MSIEAIDTIAIIMAATVAGLVLLAIGYVIIDTIVYGKEKK